MTVRRHTVTGRPIASPGWAEARNLLPTGEAIDLTSEDELDEDDEPLNAWGTTDRAQYEEAMAKFVRPVVPEGMEAWQLFAGGNWPNFFGKQEGEDDGER
jgi:hypothetical protein